jgi:hypothetical protein
VPTLVCPWHPGSAVGKPVERVGENGTADMVMRGKSPMDNTQWTEWLHTLELAQVTITATIDPAGRLGAVGGLWPKLLVAATEAATLGLLRVVVIAEEQADVASELLAPDASPLRECGYATGGSTTTV